MGLSAWEAVGVLGTTIVAADGQVSPGTVVGSNEGNELRWSSYVDIVRTAPRRLPRTSTHGATILRRLTLG